MYLTFPTLSDRLKEPLYCVVIELIILYQLYYGFLIIHLFCGNDKIYLVVSALLTSEMLGSQSYLPALGDGILVLTVFSDIVLNAFPEKENEFLKAYTSAYISCERLTRICEVPD